MHISARAFVSAALLLAAVQATQAQVDITGVLATGSHRVAVDMATFMCPNGAYSFPTPGWGGDSATTDTFAFPSIPEPPDLVMLTGTIDDSALAFSMATPKPDSWYVIPGSPAEAKVKLMWGTDIEEPGPRADARPALTVSPSLIAGAALIRASAIGGQACLLDIHDAAGNRVRTLLLRSRGGAASAFWNADDDRGLPLPEGVYYCSLRGATRPRVGKLVLAR
jgi:hypothetical protein